MRSTQSPLSQTLCQKNTNRFIKLGLQGLLKNRAEQLTGIKMVIDTQDWNPATDKHLIKPYSWFKNITGKKAVKKAVQQANLDWALNPNFSGAPPAHY